MGPDARRLARAGGLALAAGALGLIPLGRAPLGTLGAGIGGTVAAVGVLADRWLERGLVRLGVPAPRVAMAVLGAVVTLLDELDDATADVDSHGAAGDPSPSPTAQP